MPDIAAGSNKITVIGKQVALGTPKTGAGGQILRRESCTFKLDKAQFKSNELLSHRQSTGSRFGQQSSSAKLSGPLSPSTYKLLMASSLRKDFVAGINSGAQVNITAASSGAGTGAGTFTRAAGSYLTDGFKIGDVVRWTGWLTTGVPNNAHNFWIVALTATVMTVQSLDGVDVGAKAAGDSVTATVQGKKTIAPLTAHTDDYFTFEEFYQDLGKSELYSDTKLGMMNIDLPAGGNSKASFDLVGLRRQKFSAQQLTTPTTETSTGICTMVSGLLLANGVVVANVTGMQLAVNENAALSGPVVGSKVAPDITVGEIEVSGQFTAYFSDTTLSDLYDAESVLSLAAVSAADNTPAADFVAFTLGRVRLAGDAPDDSDKGVIRTYPFVAEINNLGGTGTAADQTIMAVQDSAA